MALIFNPTFGRAIFNIVPNPPYISIPDNNLHPPLFGPIGDKSSVDVFVTHGVLLFDALFRYYNHLPLLQLVVSLYPMNLFNDYFAVFH